MTKSKAYRRCEAQMNLQCSWHAGGKDGPMVGRYRLGILTRAWGHFATWTMSRMLAVGMRLDEFDSRMPEWWHWLMGRKS